MTPFFNRLFRVVSDRRLVLVILGETGREFIYLVRSLRQKKNAPNLLIAAGFHGEEIAGPYAILKFLENPPDCYFNGVNLSFLPCVNPIGFNKKQRYARRGEKTNCGFYHFENGDRLSVEGKILVNNLSFLLGSSSHGFLSLHEDTTVKKFYQYTFGPDLEPGTLARSMRNEELRHFDPLPDFTEVNEENDPDAIVENGIVYNLHDGSFEDLLYHKGIKNIVVTETPSRGIPLDRRVDAGVALITKFIELSV